MSFAENAGVLIIGQIVSKLFTFSLNQLLLFYTTPAALGITQLVEFVLDYTFFLSREAIRLTISKLKNDEKKIYWSTNYSYLSSLIYIVLGLPTIYYKIIKNESNFAKALQPFTLNHLSLCILLCAFLELQTEPYYNVNQYINGDTTRRAKIEGLAGFNRCIFQFISVLFISPILGLSKHDVNAYVFGYCIGQLVYSITIYLCYLRAFNFYFYVPQRVNSLWFEPNSFSYFKSIFVQLIFKNFLTVGDKFIITSLLAIESQGNYSFISNYGSLIARMVFAPIEESTRITLSNIFKDNNKVTQKKDFLELEACLSNIAKIYTYVLTLLIVFAPLNSEFLLLKIFKNFSSKDIIYCFKLYWVYVIFLAVNGIVEALFQSLYNSKNEVNRYSVFMLFNTAIFFCTLILFIGKMNLGLAGLIYANILNMFMRISYCYLHVKSYISAKEKSTGKQFSLNTKKYYMFIVFSALALICQKICFSGDVKTMLQFLISGFCGFLLFVYIAFVEGYLKLKKSKTD